LEEDWVRGVNKGREHGKVGDAPKHCVLGFTIEMMLLLNVARYSSGF
jgi:hypothetical protein